MYIRKAQIKNFKGIEDMTIDFQPGFNLIKGENGKGKTSILEALANGLGIFTSKLSTEYNPSISKEDVREQYRFSDRATFSRYRCYPVEIDLDVALDNRIGLTDACYDSSDAKAYSACVSPDFTKCAIGRAKSIEIIDIADFEKVSLIENVLTDSPAICLSYSPDGKRLIALHSDSSLSVWDASTFSLTNKIRSSSANIPCFKATELDSLVFLVNDYSFKIWSLHVDEDDSTYYSKTKIKCISTYDHFILICTEDNTIRLYDMQSLQEDIENTEPLKTFQGHENFVYSMEISKDQTLLASTDSVSTRIWDLSSGECLNNIALPSNPSATAISPDGKCLLHVFGQLAYIWDIVTGEHTKTLYGEEWKTIFSSFVDASRIISISERGTIRYWANEPESLHLNCYRLGDGSSTSSKTTEETTMLANKLENDMDASLPVLSYQSAYRGWISPKINGELLSRQFERKDGYENALNGKCDVQSLTGWCLMMEVTALQRSTTMKAYEEVKETVASFMSYMDDGKQSSVFIDRNTFSLMYTEDGLSLPAFRLSAGYQSLIWMVFDIAYRMALLNPMSSTKINDTPGIVLIDELDVHLHPTWQWKVINGLRKTFPNVQFIASTHSPFLFASAHDIWIIDIEEETPGYSYSRYGYDVSNSTNMFQNNASLPKELHILEQDFYKAMDDEDYVSAKKILGILEEKSYGDTPLLVELNTMYLIESNISSHSL